MKTAFLLLMCVVLFSEEQIVGENMIQLANVGNEIQKFEVFISPDKDDAGFRHLFIHYGNLVPVSPISIKLVAENKMVYANSDIMKGRTVKMGMIRIKVKISDDLIDKVKVQWILGVLK